MSRMKPMHIEVPEDAMCEVLRLKTEAERLAIAFRMWTFARDMIRANLREERPDWPTDEIERQAGKRLAHGNR